MRPTPSILLIVLCVISISRASAAVDVTITPAIRPYCHIVRFPQGWKIINYDPVIKQGLYYGYDGLYEFRVPGILETTFLLAGVVRPRKQYTINKYRVDLADPKAIAMPATEKEWQDGTKIPDSRLSDWKTFGIRQLTNANPLPFHGFQFAKTGDIWSGEYARLSPDKTWIVVMSSSGKTAKHDDFIFSSGRDKGTLFFDVYNADSGKNLVTIQARYLDIEPGLAVNQAIWVTERYFIIPLGEHRERCMVCDFGLSQQR